jgi:hypothetical protein
MKGASLSKALRILDKRPVRPPQLSASVMPTAQSSPSARIQRSSSKLHLSPPCITICQSVAMHTMKRRFSGSKQHMIISKLNSTTRNGPSACCPTGNTSAPAAPAVPSPAARAAAAGTRTTLRAACADDMEEDNIGGQTRAHFFKSVHKSAKCAVGRINAYYF